MVEQSRITVEVPHEKVHIISNNLMTYNKSKQYAYSVIGNVNLLLPFLWSLPLHNLDGVRRHPAFTSVFDVVILFILGKLSSNAARAKGESNVVPLARSVELLF